MKTCNQCGSELDTIPLRSSELVNPIEPDIHVCANPECPNYAVVQIPSEDMPKE